MCVCGGGGLPGDMQAPLPTYMYMYVAGLGSGLGVAGCSNLVNGG